MKHDAVTPSFRQALCERLPKLRRYACNLAGTPHDADDLLQVAAERALARAAQWDPDQPLDPWLYRIVRNAWIDEVRARRRGQALFADAELGEQVGVASVESHAVRLSVEAAMARLPEEQRSAIALVLVEGLAYREAAQALEIPVGTLTSRLARGREALQALLGDESGEVQ
ncbi:RNA polymerase sigma factor [Pseudoxanthomonas composti]|uniref:Sigma-70 family RNA polymerase sigma factor n=1 Tax=Pseudoxanthomonas composti TaxID=2137479 RepID=A0A4Q1JUH7_9GAMM|nr:sigma-70 family RNA polymerase sigma factor [Pseudoxanthomonas composti]RXR04412.1 sigma-70 family RNA polymerase sigma factor [Pseudoxanthomonas composti]